MFVHCNDLFTDVAMFLVLRTQVHLNCLQISKIQGNYYFFVHVDNQYILTKVKLQVFYKLFIFIWRSN